MANLQGSQRSKYVEEMFDRISKRYDLMNSLMSAGRHKNWRREATIEAVSNKLSGECLDVATGAGDFIFRETCTLTNLLTLRTTNSQDFSKTRTLRFYFSENV